MSDELAFSMKPHVRAAMAIIFGQMEGNSWDWGRMRWRERK